MSCEPLTSPAKGNTLRRPLILLGLLLYVFAFQGSRGLWEPDEGRYTAVALEMERLGDYVTPRLHPEVKHLSKPPLTYWALATSMKALGGSEWALRIPNALAFLATILLVARLGRRLAPASSALAPLIYATCLLPFAAAGLGWYVLLWIRQPADIEHLVRYEILGRIFTPVHDRNAAWYGPFVIYVPSLLVGSLPWTGRIFEACSDTWRSLVRRRGSDTAPRDPVSCFLFFWLISSLAIFCLARSRMHLYVLPLFVPMALLAARRQTAFSLSPRRRLGLALWIVFLISLRGVAAGLPTTKDSRVLAQVIAGRARGPVDEVVFVDTLPRYGLAFYLGADVEAVTLKPPVADDPAGNSARTESLDEEFRAEEGSRLFIMPHKRSAAFLDLSRTLGFTVLPLGGWHGLELYRDLSNEKRGSLGRD